MPHFLVCVYRYVLFFIVGCISGTLSVEVIWDLVWKRDPQGGFEFASATCLGESTSQNQFKLNSWPNGFFFGLFGWFDFGQANLHKGWCVVINFKKSFFFLYSFYLLSSKVWDGQFSLQFPGGVVGDEMGGLFLLTLIGQCGHLEYQLEVGAEVGWGKVFLLDSLLWTGPGLTR